MISREEFWRLVRFGFVGGGATLVDLGTSIALFHTWPTISEHLVTTLAFAIAFWFSFFGHRYITFQKQGAASKFLLVALFSLAVRNLILSGLLGINSQFASVLFVLVFSCFVWHSTRAVDRISVVLIAFMVLSFVFGVSGLAANIDATRLFHSLTEELGQAPYALAMLPVALTSFGYHHSVASMRAYYGEEQKAKQAILGGTLIALALYLLWLLSIFGNLPRNAFGPIIAKGGDVDVLLGALASVIESKRVSNAINLFSMAAILSSFIGVGLGVFDYLADLFKFDNSRAGRAKSWGVTFLPPLLLSLLFPFGFVVAIGYAGAAATVWACIIPALLAKKSRELAPQGGGFKAPGGQPMVVAVIVFGVLTAVFHLMAMAGMLPIYTG